MSSYYTTHPNLGISAMVTAPATEKARTTFLDFLERSGQINRADRQHWRKNMVAEKMEDPYEIQADVELHYGYEGAPSRVAVVGDRVPSEFLEAEGSGEVVERYEEPVPELDVRQFEEVVEEEPQQLNLSPIARKALGGYAR